MGEDLDLDWLLEELESATYYVQDGGRGAQMTPEYKILDGAVRRSPECMWDHEDYEVRVQFQNGYEIPEEIFNNNDVDDEG